MDMTTLEIRKLKAVRGWLWVRQGYQLIMRNPLFSVALALVCTLAMFLVFRIPVIGQFLALMLMPMIITGYARVCRALEEDEPVKFSHLLAGFEKHAKRLFALGGILMLGVLISSMTMILIGGSRLAGLFANMHTITSQPALNNAMQAAGPMAAFSLLVGFVLICVLMLAFQYAPMLVYFNNLKPFAAFRASLAGSLRNIIPYTLYSIIIQLITLILSLLPYNIGLILLLPLGLTSLYVSYRNIFPFEGEIPAPEA